MRCMFWMLCSNVTAAPTTSIKNDEASGFDISLLLKNIVSWSATEQHDDTHLYKQHNTIISAYHTNEHQIETQHKLKLDGCYYVILHSNAESTR